MFHVDYLTPDTRNLSNDLLCYFSVFNSSFALFINVRKRTKVIHLIAELHFLGLHFFVPNMPLHFDALPKNEARALCRVMVVGNETDSSTFHLHLSSSLQS